jgi:acyl-CoA thioester hydrolase
MSEGPDGVFSHLAGRLEGGVHRLPVRVYYEDTDFSRHVYHASYIRFLERGRTELLRSVAVAQSDLYSDANGLVFVVRRMTVDFTRPARMDDVLTVLTSPRDIRGASMILHQRIHRADELLLTAEVTVAAVRSGRAVRIPDRLRELLTLGPD